MVYLDRFRIGHAGGNTFLRRMELFRAIPERNYRKLNAYITAQERLLVPRLLARSVAAGADLHGFAGTVYSVHRDACYLAVETQLAAVLVAAPVGNMPQGILIDASDTFSFARYVTPGMAVSLRHGLLRAGPQVTVDLRTSSPWQDTVRAGSVDLNAPAQSSAWQVAWSTLLPRAMTSLDELRLILGLDGLEIDQTAEALERRASFPIRRLLPGRAQPEMHLDERELRVLFSAMVGVGPGLTPSGDDLLVGYLLGLHSTARCSPRAQTFLESARTLVRELAERTTPVSRFFLYNAVEARSTARMAHLIDQIASGAADAEVQRATTAAMSVGATSGRAGVLGLLLGLAAWSTREWTAPIRPLTQRDFTYVL